MASDHHLHHRRTEAEANDWRALIPLSVVTSRVTCGGKTARQRSSNSLGFLGSAAKLAFTDN
jgi:hypothetical protein